MPFLAAILGPYWNKEWAPYASLVTIEIYSPATMTGNDLFRIVYNGAEQIVPGCVDTLCDVSFLHSALSFGQKNMPCSATPPSPSTSSSSSCIDSGGLDTTDWSLIAVAALVLGLVCYIN